MKSQRASELLSCLGPKPPCPLGPWQQTLPGEEEKREDVPSNLPPDSICHPVVVSGLGTSRATGYLHTITLGSLVLPTSCSEIAPLVETMSIACPALLTS